MEITGKTKFVDLHAGGALSNRLWNKLNKRGFDRMADVIKLAELDVIQNSLGLNDVQMEELRTLCLACPGVSIDWEKLVVVDAFSYLDGNEKQVIEEIYANFLVDERNQNGWMQHAFPTAADLFNVMRSYQESQLCLGNDKTPGDYIDRSGIMLDFLTALRERITFTDERKDWVQPLFDRLYVSLDLSLRCLPTFLISNGYVSNFGRYLLELKLDEVSNRYSPPLAYYLRTDAQLKDACMLLSLDRSEYNHIERLAWLRRKDSLVIESSINEFKPILFQILKMDDVSMRMKYLQDVYWFLNDEDAAFVRSFFQEKGHMPLFYMTYRLLQVSENRLFDIYSRAHGLKDGVCHQVQELASDEHLTEKQVMDILKSDLRKKILMLKLEDTSHYEPLFNRPFLTELSPEVKELVREERLPEDFAKVIWLLKAVIDSKTCKSKKKILLINNNVPWRNVPWPLIFDEYKFKDKKRFAVNEYLRNLDYTPEQEEDAKALIRYIGKEAYGFSLDEQDRFYLPERKQKGMKR